MRRQLLLSTVLSLAMCAVPVAAKEITKDMAKDPGQGATTFNVYEAFLSPQQEPAEEDEAPKGIKPESTPPFTPRESRKSRGYGQLRFARDLSKAFVEVQIAGVNPADIVMFHIHCGPPGFLGPILVDLGSLYDLKKAAADGKYVAEITNKNIKMAKMFPPGAKLALPEACPVDFGFPPSPDDFLKKQPLANQVKTLSGMEYLAKKGVLYFNLHTKTHAFYGEMRGQISAAKE
ncbi:MAG TPA: CHRD domain-containing protein [Pseudomonadota bacterium]|nr:CHRD domain-containing protein [Pseudomonadota bacterium]